MEQLKIIRPNKLTHPLFKVDLKKSMRGVRYVAYILEKEFGCEVDVPPLSVADDVEDRGKFIDGGDIIVTGFRGIKCHEIVEVKKLTYHFTGHKNWPHKPHYFICSKENFDQKDKKPWSYLSLNKDATYWGRVLISSQSYWYEKLMTHYYNGEKQSGMRYTIHYSHVRWYKIPAEYVLLRRKFFGNMIRC